MCFLQNETAPLVEVPLQLKNDWIGEFHSIGTDSKLPEKKEILMTAQLKGHYWNEQIPEINMQH